MFIVSAILNAGFVSPHSQEEVTSLQSMVQPAWLVLPAFTALLLISAIYLIIKYIYYEVKKPSEKKTPCLIHYSGLTFFIISCVILILHIVATIGVSYDHQWTEDVLISAIVLYFVVQIYLLWFVMFIKIYYVFKGSVYQLSSCTVKFFIALFVIIPLPLMIMAGMALIGDYTYRLVIYGIIVLFSIILASLFIYKLYQIFRDSQKGNTENKMDLENRFLSTMTKTTILTFASISVTMLVPLLTQDEIAVFVFMSLWDIYTNFIFVMLSYTPFNDQYQKCCGCCDRNCRKCLFKMVSNNAEPVSQSSPSSTDVKVSEIIVGDELKE